jgi:hypothetical protein
VYRHSVPLPTMWNEIYAFAEYAKWGKSSNIVSLCVFANKRGETLKIFAEYVYIIHEMQLCVFGLYAKWNCIFNMLNDIKFKYLDQFFSKKLKIFYVAHQGPEIISVTWKCNGLTHYWLCHILRVINIRSDNGFSEVLEKKLKIFFQYKKLEKLKSR